MVESSQNTKERGLHIIYHKNAQNIIICIKVTWFKYDYSGGKWTFKMGYFQEKKKNMLHLCVLLLVVSLDLAILLTQLLSTPADPRAWTE